MQQAGQVAWSLTMLLLLLLAAAAQARQLHSQDAAAAPGTAEYYAQLISAASPVHRLIQKQGMLPIKLWSRNFDYSPFRAWVRERTVRAQSAAATTTSITTTPIPRANGCALLVNHKYKFILVRNRKAASTSIVKAVGLCETREHPACLEFLYVEDFVKHGIDPANAWKEYFIFTNSRNPWARAASAYEYLTDEWHNSGKGGGACDRPAFPDFCQDPTILGTHSNLFRCNPDDRWNHEWFHTESVAPCISDELGRPAIDFVVRYENLAEDFEALLVEINKRRNPKLDVLQAHKLGWNKKSDSAESEAKRMKAARKLNASVDAGGSNNSGSSVSWHAQKYVDCGMPCVRDIAKFYADDLSYFGYETPQ